MISSPTAAAMAPATTEPSDGAELLGSRADAGGSTALPEAPEAAVANDAAGCRNCSLVTAATAAAAAQMEPLLNSPRSGGGPGGLRVPGVSFARTLPVAEPSGSVLTCGADGLLTFGADAREPASSPSERTPVTLPVSQSCQSFGASGLTVRVTTSSNTLDPELPRRAATTPSFVGANKTRSCAPSSNGALGLLEGEVLLGSFAGKMECANAFQCNALGDLRLTNYRLIFAPAQRALDRGQRWMRECGLFDIPLGSIYDTSLEGAGRAQTFLKADKEQKVKVSTMDFRCFVITVKDRKAQQFFDELRERAHPGNMRKVFAFDHAKAIGGPFEAEEASAGHEAIYESVREFGRMGVETTGAPSARCPWALRPVNVGHNLCGSYPESLVVPKVITDEELAAVAKYRRRGRIPTLSWCGGESLGWASVWRCSQPKDGLGIASNGCPEDQRLLDAIRQAANESLETSRFLRVLDLRSETAAWGNKVTGGGFENYKGCRVEFGNIGNIHDVTRAWNEMGAAVGNVVDGLVGSWWKDVAASSWYDIIGNVLRCAVLAVQEVHMHKSSLVIHCSDGWDRTSQVTSLAALCMDPYLRTKVGFLNLIQRDFCSFGHLFKTRLAQVDKHTDQFSPIFLQWLECVYQLLLQFPEEFEFKEELLLRLAEDVMSHRYGSLLFDTDRERKEEASRFLSLWTVLMEEDFSSGLYSCSGKPLVPNVSQVHTRVWEGYWFRFHPHGRHYRRQRALSEAQRSLDPEGTEDVDCSPVTTSHTAVTTIDTDISYDGFTGSGTAMRSIRSMDEVSVPYTWQRVERGDRAPARAVLVGSTARDGKMYVGRYVGEAGKVNTSEDGLLWNVWTPSCIFKVPDRAGEILVLEEGYNPEWVPAKKGDPWPEGIVVEAGSTYAARVRAKDGSEACKVTMSGDRRVMTFVSRDNGTATEGEILVVVVPHHQPSFIRTASMRFNRRGTISSFFPSPADTRTASTCGATCRAQCAVQ